MTVSAIVRTAFIALVAALSTACAHLEPLEDWASHPLSGKIWDTRQRHFLTREEAVARAGEARFVLLGESHNHPRQQRIEAQVVQALTARKPPFALVMEQLDTDRQGVIDEALAKPGAEADALRAVANIAKGWDWDYYEPIVAAALRARVPLAAGNVARTQARSVVSKGFEALGEGVAERTGIEKVWNEDRQKVLRALIVAGHCGKDAGAVIDGLTKAQRAKDATMADVLLRFDRAVGVMGRGHARRDVGVPIYLAQRAPDAKVLVIGLIEVADDRQDAQAYAGPAEAPHYDLLWFTPRVHRPDPCAGR